MFGILLALNLVPLSGFGLLPPSSGLTWPLFREKLGATPVKGKGENKHMFNVCPTRTHKLTTVFITFQCTVRYTMWCVYRCILPDVAWPLFAIYTTSVSLNLIYRPSQQNNYHGLPQ